MTCGFKTGPKNWEEGKTLVTNEGADMCEIWFMVDDYENYKENLKWFTEHDVSLGLHHWAFCRGGIKNNLSTHHREVRDETIAQIKKTIDAARENGCVYVNIHPGSRYVEKVTFSPWSSSIVRSISPTSTEEADKLLIEAVNELNDYAKAKDVLLLVETLCGAESLVASDRSKVYWPGNSSLEAMKKLIEAGNFIANDLTHTATSPQYEGGATPEKMWQVLESFTRETHAATKLLHVNTLMPPYNGTDSHDGISQADWDKGVFPDKKQVQEILTWFKGRDDVYLIPEPKQDMTVNYLALKSLVTEL